MTFNEDNFNASNSNVEIIVSNVASSEAEANAEEGTGDVTELPFVNNAEVHSSNQATSKSDNDKSSKILVGAAALLLVGLTAFSAVTMKSSNDLVSNLSSAAAAPADSKSSKAPKAGKGLPTNPTILGRISTDTASSCAAAVGSILATNDFAGCSRYWYTGDGGQSSTCTGNTYVADPSGNTPANSNPGINTCLGVGDSPGCYVLEGVNDDEPILVRTSVAWDWSKYNIPFTSPSSGSCATVTTLLTDTPFNTCADILTVSSIPVVAADFTTGGPPGDGVEIGTTGQCYSKCAFLSAFVTSCLSEEKSYLTHNLSSRSYSATGTCLSRCYYNQLNSHLHY